MSWNYRLVLRVWTRPDGEIEVRIAVHEAYYPENSDTPNSITTDPVYPSGESVEELERDRDAYLKAWELPILNWRDF